MPTTKSIQPNDAAEFWAALVSELVERGEPMPAAIAWAAQTFAAIGRLGQANRATVRLRR
jgi:hypothetical protein